MTNIVVGLCSIVFVLVTAIGSLGQAFVAHSRAQNAADLAALAAADAVRGLATGEPCEIAEEVVERNGGQMSDCLAERTVGLCRGRRRHTGSASEGQGEGRGRKMTRSVEHGAQQTQCGVLVQGLVAVSAFR